jgi:cytochrome c oxidase subunit 3
MMMAQIQQKEDRLNLQPKKFVMWLFVFASFMIFAALTSGFMVYAGGRGHALNVILPNIFMYSTGVLILSSVTLFLATRAAKRLDVSKQRLFITITMILGLIFFGLQIDGWHVLTEMNIFFVEPNASRSFIYIFTGVHLLHIIAGLLLLMSALYTTYRNKPQSIIQFRLEIASIFWHFLDIIWIYLYVFLLLNQN